MLLVSLVERARVNKAIRAYTGLLVIHIDESIQFGAVQLRQFARAVLFE